MSKVNTEIRIITIPLIDGGQAVLTVPLPLSQENFDHLAGWFKFMEKALAFQARKLEKSET